MLSGAAGGVWYHRSITLQHICHRMRAEDNRFTDGTGLKFGSWTSRVNVPSFLCPGETGFCGSKQQYIPVTRTRRGMAVLWGHHLWLLSYPCLVLHNHSGTCAVRGITFHSCRTLPCPVHTSRDTCGGGQTGASLLPGVNACVLKCGFGSGLVIYRSMEGALCRGTEGKGLRVQAYPFEFHLLCPLPKPFGSQPSVLLCTQVPVFGGRMAQGQNVP